jgi:chemotaxis protein methyltransferase CheR
MNQTALKFRHFNDRDLSLLDFQRISAAVQRESGMELPESKLHMTHSRLLGRLRTLGMTGFGEYCDFVERPENDAERLEMLSALTTNVTGFFREPHHFEFLRKQGIPPLAARLRAGGSVRVWSAGCSTGEEPYSIALTFLQLLPNAGKLDLKILATDIDPNVLRSALAGEFFKSRLDAIPRDLKERYFLKSPENSERYQICNTVRNLIAFRRLNLAGPWPFSRAFDVIFCRNVVIYFDAASKADVWEKLIGQLAPRGLLMTGHSERLSGDTASNIRCVASTTYQMGDHTSPKKGKSKCR